MSRGGKPGVPMDRGRAMHAVREALDTFAAGPVREEILRRALEAGGVPDVPDAPDELAAWIDGPLRHAVLSLFDDRTAEALVAALDPIVGLAEDSGVHDRAELDAFASETGRAVFCVDVSGRDVEHAKKYAGASATVWNVHDHLQLGDAVVRSGADEVCVLVDTREVRPRAGRMGALVRQLPSGARVVLWGATEADTTLLGAGHRELEWLAVGERATLSEVVSVCTVPSVSGTRRRPSVVDRPVLIVEHDGGRRRALSEQVTSLGYAVVTASSGAEALATCSRRLPLLVIVDQTLPGMSGTELARLLRSSAEDEAPPVILVVRDVLEGTDAAAIAAAVPEGVTDAKLGPLLRKLASRHGGEQSA